MGLGTVTRVMSLTQVKKISVRNSIGRVPSF